MKVFLIIFGVLLLTVCAVLFFAVRYLYRFAMLRRPGPQKDLWEMTPEELPGVDAQFGPPAVKLRIWEAKCRLVLDYAERGRKYTITSVDGLTLGAHYLPPRGEMRGVFLMVHGYRSAGLSDFCCAMEDMMRDGFGCFAIDQRAHGISEGDTICFGVKERYDVLEWAKFIEREFPGMPVLLDGVSMGSATVMAASALDLPPNVRGIIADCGYTSMRGIFNKVIRQKFRLPPFPLVLLAGLYCRLKNGFDFDTVHSAEALSHARVPVLLAHGVADDFVPFTMAEEIYNAVKDTVDIELVAVENAGHGVSYLENYEQYYAALCRLYKKTGVM